MTARAAHRRARNTGPQPIPPKTPEVPAMQQPTQPPVKMTDSALWLIWEPHDKAMADAQASAGLATPLEQRSRDNRKLATEKRMEAERLVTEAERLEDAAAADEHKAELHRQDEDHHRDNAHQIANNVEFLRQTNGLLHPADRAQRAALAAAANGPHAALNAPIGELVSNGVSETAPLPVAEVNR